MSGADILFVEDDQEILDLWVPVLREAGYEATPAVNADIAVILLEQGLPFRLLITGVVLAKEVADQGVGVILVTGSHDHFEAVEKSGHRYLFKPFRIESLLSLAD